MDLTKPTLPDLASSTRNGDTVWKFSFSAEILFKMKKVCFASLLPTQGNVFQRPHTTLLEIQARLHRPPRSPTREGSQRLWDFIASALTLVLAGTYTLRVTPGDSDHP
ncbi:hypothetical protein AVEN_171602-1 [Araneus ventricosus]|uniref:Uncharacterized protein n=1 Tax=Araneus ventricosus TaxID=182803 RepID=A0A4Y2U7C3_ARAVE|nr:hypothetical protein AVEN_171602-1 [Araneus ventricosus]